METCGLDVVMIEVVNTMHGHEQGSKHHACSGNERGSRHHAVETCGSVRAVRCLATGLATSRPTTFSSVQFSSLLFKLQFSSVLVWFGLYWYYLLSSIIIFKVPIWFSGTMYWYYFLSFFGSLKKHFLNFH